MEKGIVISGARIKDTWLLFVEILIKSFTKRQLAVDQKEVQCWPLECLCFVSQTQT